MQLPLCYLKVRSSFLYMSRILGVYVQVVDSKVSKQPYMPRFPGLEQIRVTIAVHVSMVIRQSQVPQLNNLRTTPTNTSTRLPLAAICFNQSQFDLRFILSQTFGGHSRGGRLTLTTHLPDGLTHYSVYCHTGNTLRTTGLSRESP